MAVSIQPIDNWKDLHHWLENHHLNWNQIFMRLQAMPWANFYRVVIGKHSSTLEDELKLDRYPNSQLHYNIQSRENPLVQCEVDLFKQAGYSVEQMKLYPL